MFFFWLVVLFFVYSDMRSTMVVEKVVVHPEGLGPKEAAKAWYSVFALFCFFVFAFGGGGGWG